MFTILQEVWHKLRAQPLHPSLFVSKLLSQTHWLNLWDFTKGFTLLKNKFSIRYQIPRYWRGKLSRMDFCTITVIFILTSLRNKGYKLLEKYLVASVHILGYWLHPLHYQTLYRLGFPNKLLFYDKLFESDCNDLECIGWTLQAG